MTISPPAVLLGSQTPRVLTRPEYTSEASGREAIDLATSVGLILDPWQRLCTLVTLAEYGNVWAAREVGKLVARQNGKGASDEAIALHGLFLLGLPLQLWTAHQFKTTTEAFLRIRSWVDGSDDLRRRVKRITTANGDEGIELTTGARLRFIARSRSSGRGFSPQRIFFDEAQELATVAVNAMMPSMSAQPNPQSLYSGTVPDDDNNAEFWTRVRTRGRAGNSALLAWLEWSPKGSPEGLDSVDLDDPATVIDSNPALGYRVPMQTIQAESESLDPASYARERLSVWPDYTGSSVINPETWNSRIDEDSRITSPVVFAVDTSTDRSSTSIAVGGRRDDGLVHVELVRSGRGTGWVLAELIRLQAAWGGTVVLDGASPAASLVPSLQDSNLKVSTTAANDMARACGGFYDAVTEDGMRHLGDPLLAKALLAAGRRPLAGGWAWDRKSGDIAPLVAVTLAFYGVQISSQTTNSQLHEWPDEAELEAWEDDDDPDHLDPM